MRNRLLRNVLVVTGVGLCLAVPSAAFAQAGDDIDDLLGIPDGDTTPDKPADDTAEPDADDGLELEDDLMRQLDGAAAADVFAKAQQSMEDVAKMLREEHDAGKDTVREQDVIIARLDQIIRSAKKQQQQSSSSSSEPSDGEPQDGKAKGKPQGKEGQQPGQEGEGEGQGEQGKEGEGQGEEPQMAEGNPSGQGSESSQGSPSRGQVGADGSTVSMKDLREGEWGNLPPRLRHELTEGIEEAFSPVYRRQTEAFYRRIAESLRSNDE